MHQEALLRSRLLSARQSHLQLSGLGTPGTGATGDEDGGFPLQQPPPAALLSSLGDVVLSSSAPSTLDGGDGRGRPISSLAMAAAAANRAEAAAAGVGGNARGRSISFSLSLPGTGTCAGADGDKLRAGTAAPTPGSVTGPAERYTTLDLFPDYPEQFLPQVQDFQRVIILNTPEPPDGDTQAACKQLRKAMKLRSKWLGVPLEPEAHVGRHGEPQQQQPQPQQKEGAWRPESPTATMAASSQPPSSPGSPRSLQNGACVVCVADACFACAGWLSTFLSMI